MKIQDFTGAARQVLGKLSEAVGEASTQLINKAREERVARAKAKADAKQKEEQEQARIREEQQESARARVEAEAKRKAERQERFNSLLTKSRSAIEKSLRELPDGTRIFLDTCLIMNTEADFGLDIWFNYLRENVTPRHWQVILLNAVKQELDHNKDNSEHPEKARKVRSGVKWLKMLQENIGERLRVLGAPKKDWETADNIFHKYMQTGDVLFTLDLLLYINTKAEHKLEARLPIDLTAEEAEALCRLSVCYRSGAGVERNEYLAQAWLTLAAGRDAGAMNLLGEQSGVSLAYGIPYKSYNDADKDERKIKEAENNRWYKAAANAGNPIAMIHRGEFDRAKSYYRMDDRPGWFFQNENGSMDLSTSLSWAVQLGKTEMVAELFQRGADVRVGCMVKQVKNKMYTGEELRPLLYVAVQKGYLDIAKLILEKGADVNESGDHGTALSAAQSTEMIELLLKYGAKANVSSWQNVIERDLIDAVRLFREYGQIVGDGSSRSYILFYAIRSNRLEIVKMLVEMGDDINGKDGMGDTPLHEAAKYGHEHMCRLLLEMGAKINKKNKYGDTPLHYSTENKHDQVSRMLIEKGADAKARNKSGEKPIDRMARKGWDKDFIESLRHPILHQLKNKVLGGHDKGR